jgi:uncharacterized membrane protein
MHKGRFEAFSDGVMAIIITIMVLELKVPHGGDLEAIKPLYPVFLSYLLSFIYIGIYWNNHHHMMQLVTHVNGASLWANLHLLFWLSLVPFATGWMGENHFTTWTVAIYGGIMMMAGIAYYILAHALIRANSSNHMLADAVGKDWKGISSVVIYVFAIAFAFVNASVSLAVIALVAAMWLIPDRRIEKKLMDEQQHHER